MAGFTLPISVPPYEVLDPALAKIEKSFGYFTWIPFVGVVPGVLQQFYGTIELTVAVTAVVFNLIRGLFMNEQDTATLSETSGFILHNYALRGLANIVYGQIACIPFVNLLLYYHNRHLKYEFENLSEDTQTPAHLGRSYSISVEARRLRRSMSRRSFSSLYQATIQQPPSSRAHYPVLDRTLAKIEKGLESFAWIPFFGVVPGVLQQFYGAIEFCIAITLVIFHLGYGLFVDEGEDKISERGGFILYNYAMHGIANIIYGQIACIPVINLILYLYNTRPELRMKYEGEDE